MRVIGGRSRLPTLCIRLEDGIQAIGGTISREEEQAAARAVDDPDNFDVYAADIQRARRAQMVRALLDKTYTVDFPFPCLGRVVAARDADGWHRVKRGQIKLERCDGWAEEVAAVVQQYKEKRGVDVGATDLLLEVAPLRGIVHTPAFDIVPEFDASKTLLVPAQAIPSSQPRVDPRFEAVQRDRSQPLLARGDACVCLAEDKFGSVGHVTHVAPAAHVPETQYTVRTIASASEALHSAVEAAAKRIAASEEVRVRVCARVHVCVCVRVF